MDVSKNTVEVDGLNITYREAGEGNPVILLHGWPTSSALWRNILPTVGEHCRAIAPDMPGFGESDKPLDVSYGFGFFDRFLDGFTAALKLETLSLVVHDLGGPIGLHWASQNPERIDRLGILNTIVYPEMSWMVKAFVIGARLPGLRHALTSQWGLKRALYLGVCNKDRLREDAVETFQAPFRTSSARQALAKAGVGLNPGEFSIIADWIGALDRPVRVIYGTGDRILPDMPKTAERLQRDCPKAEVTALQGCGHFLQEEEPEEVALLLAEFLGDASEPS